MTFTVVTFVTLVASNRRIHGNRVWWTIFLVVLDYHLAVFIYQRRHVRRVQVRSQYTEFTTFVCPDFRSSVIATHQLPFLHFVVEFNYLTAVDCHVTADSPTPVSCTDRSTFNLQLDTLVLDVTGIDQLGRSTWFLYRTYRHNLVVSVGLIVSEVDVQAFVEEASIETEFDWLLDFRLNVFVETLTQVRSSRQYRTWTVRSIDRFLFVYTITLNGCVCRSTHTYASDRSTQLTEWEPFRHLFCECICEHPWSICWWIEYRVVIGCFNHILRISQVRHPVVTASQFQEQLVSPTQVHDSRNTECLLVARSIVEFRFNLVLRVREWEITRDNQTTVSALWPRVAFCVTVKFCSEDSTYCEILIPQLECLFRHLQHTHKVVFTWTATATAVTTWTRRTVVSTCTYPTVFRTDVVVIVVSFQACSQEISDLGVQLDIGKDRSFFTLLQLSFTSMVVTTQSTECRSVFYRLVFVTISCMVISHVIVTR